MPAAHGRSQESNRIQPMNFPSNCRPCHPLLRLKNQKNVGRYHPPAPQDSYRPLHLHQVPAALRQRGEPTQIYTLTLWQSVFALPQLIVHQLTNQSQNTALIQFCVIISSKCGTNTFSSVFARCRVKRGNNGEKLRCVLQPCFMQYVRTKSACTSPTAKYGLHRCVRWEASMRDLNHCT